MIRLLQGLWLIKAFFIEILNSSLNNLSICSSNFLPPPLHLHWQYSWSRFKAQALSTEPFVPTLPLQHRLWVPDLTFLWSCLHKKNHLLFKDEIKESLGKEREHVVFSSLQWLPGGWGRGLNWELSHFRIPGLVKNAANQHGSLLMSVYIPCPLFSYQIISHFPWFSTGSALTVFQHGMLLTFTNRMSVWERCVNYRFSWSTV